MTAARRKIRYDPNNDYYIVLGVASNVSNDELQTAYRQRAKEVHPDRNLDRPAWAHEQFQRLNDAYDVLSDVEQRSAYDRQRIIFTAGKISVNSTAAYTWRQPPPPPAPQAPAAFSSTKKPGTAGYYLDFWWNVIKGMVVGPYRYTMFIIAGVLLINIGCALVYSVFNSPFPSDCSDPNLTINAPVENAVISSRLGVTGTIDDSSVTSYKVEWAALDADPGWRSDDGAMQTDGAIVDYSLTINPIDLSRVAGTKFAIRLVVTTTDHRQAVVCTVHVSRNPYP